MLGSGEQGLFARPAPTSPCDCLTHSSQRNVLGRDRVWWRPSGTDQRRSRWAGQSLGCRVLQRRAFLRHPGWGHPRADPRYLESTVRS